MTPERRNEVAKKILFWLLNNDEHVAGLLLNTDVRERISRSKNIPEEEIEELLRPFYHSYLRDRSH